MGASYLTRNVSVLAADGRLVVIGMQGGRKAELDLGMLMGKRAFVASTGLRYRPVDGPGGKAGIVAEVVAKLWPLIESGQVRPVVGQVVPMRDAAEAHRMVEASEVVGKVLLRND
jgi:NADPH:quinone reductase-like Zn-dependent oxidoreductase